MYVVTAVYNLYFNFENYALNLWIMEQLGTLRAWGLCSEKNTCTNLIASSVITEVFPQYRTLSEQGPSVK